MREENIEPVLVNSHITPLALFTTLYRYRREEVLFFDDVDSMYSSMPHLGLLRSALWGKPRIVTYGTSQKLPDDTSPPVATRPPTNQESLLRRNLVPQVVQQQARRLHLQ